jgi:ribose-phosphate pyrophosphokinase
MLLYFEEDQTQAQRLAGAAGLGRALIRRHRFPDLEVKLTLPPRVPRRAAILRTLDHPNEKLVELLFAAQTARELGARHLTLVAPYLAYMRQDQAFAPGEAVSQRHVGAFLGALFERIVTVDPHLHRVPSLAQVVPEAVTVAVSAAPLIGRHLRRRATGALLIGPDEEARQWVEAAATAAGLEWAVGRKRRRGDRLVTVALPRVPVKGRRVVLVDDVLSTGRTLIDAARRLKKAGAARVDVAVTHALFADDAGRALRSAGVRAIWSTDSVAHPTNAIALAPLLATALQARP